MAVDDVTGTALEDFRGPSEALGAAQRALRYIGYPGTRSAAIWLLGVACVVTNSRPGINLAALLEELDKDSMRHLWLLEVYGRRQAAKLRVHVTGLPDDHTG